MFISRKELDHLYKRLDTLEREVAMMDKTYISKEGQRVVYVPYQTVLEAIIKHLDVDVLAFPPGKVPATICLRAKEAILTPTPKQG